MDDRLNLGSDVRELKLGSTFASSNQRNSFHTLKYDFKPASVDLSKVATLDVSSNNQVTVTVPHLDGSGVPKTVFKGNQRNCTKECVLVIDKVTGEITLEKLHHNVQVKKTRSESTNKNVAMPPKIMIESNVQRTSSKTKVSTGVRKGTINPFSGNFVPRHSPLQGSPSYPHHKSPQSAPAWNANNNQSTLPSIPLIGLDDDMNTGTTTTIPLTSTTLVPSTSSIMQLNSGNQNDLLLPTTSSLQQHHTNQLHNSTNHSNHHRNDDRNNISREHNNHNNNNNNNNHHHNHHHNNNHNSASNHNIHHISTHNNHNMGNNNGQQQTHLQQQQQHMEHDGVGLLSSTDSSSESESSSDSDDSVDNNLINKNHNVGGQPHLGNGTITTNILNDDLRLSDSDSDD